MDYFCPLALVDNQNHNMISELMRRIQLLPIAPNHFQFLVKKMGKLAIAFLLCVMAFFSGVFPAQAASRINPQLEEQVLQIIREHPEAIIESVQAYQQQIQQQTRQAQQTFLQQLKTNPQAVIGESPATGAAALKIVLVEFSDFQCPYCALAHKSIQEFMTKHQNEVTLVYKHLPLTSIHQQALPAAKAAWAAGQQGKFWEYHDALFARQDKLGETLYLEIAKNLNLNLEKFDRDRKNADLAIQKDIQLAEKLGISGTPFFVMNNEIFSGGVQASDLEEIFARQNDRASDYDISK